MAARALLAVACLLLAGALVSCGGGDDDGAKKPADPQPSAAPPRAGGGGGAGGAAPPMVGADPAAVPSARSRFVRSVNRRCRQASHGLSTNISGSTSLDDLATQARQDRRRLQRLQRALRGARAPGSLRAAMRAYRRTLADQILLDRRIERAARAGDAQAAAVGRRHIQFNRDRRTRVARRAGLSSCLFARR